ncbi:hypothetical protein F442_22011 [Phytophthora nicotianae P10297]|uniref:Uncharacterized protein n=1 Tax=Phytophthora nicotianae P10297 TaxID=1317064 RepID=W2Y1Y0_PHYNI|nr:hypothetical protein F442_22011 [Phytophthora nicotianae P10297]
MHLMRSIQTALVVISPVLGKSSFHLDRMLSIVMTSASFISCLATSPTSMCPLSHQPCVAGRNAVEVTTAAVVPAASIFIVAGACWSGDEKGIEGHERQQAQQAQDEVACSRIN